MHIAPGMEPLDESRHRILQGLSPILLEATILKMEADGWQRVGGIALATPLNETKPPYWVQSMSRNSAPPLPADKPAS
jgi:hypothetical protein